MTEPKHEWLAKTPDDTLARKLRVVAWLLTAVVLGLVMLMREVRIPLPNGVTLSFLPATHAVINGLVAIVLVAALVAVRAGRIDWHRALILVAIGLSTLFLLGYVAYHFTTDEVRFGDANHDGSVDAAELAAVGSSRMVYLVLLVSHIVLAGLSLPMILLTFIAAWTHQYEKHRAMARRVFPIWLYVAVTGPICYWMLRPFYP